VSTRKQFEDNLRLIYKTKCEEFESKLAMTKEQYDLLSNELERIKQKETTYIPLYNTQMTEIENQIKTLQDHLTNTQDDDEKETILKNLEKQQKQLNELHWKVSRPQNHRAFIRRKKLLEKSLASIKLFMKELEAGEWHKRYKNKLSIYAQAVEKEFQQEQMEETRKQFFLNVSGENNPVSIISKSEDIIKDLLYDIESKAPDVKIIPNEYCENCDYPLVLEARSSMFICACCGNAKPELNCTSAHMAYNEDVDFTAFSYSRFNHFNERLTYAQFKENTLIPNDDIFRICEWLYKNGYTQVSKIRLGTTLQAMKALKMRAYYRQNTQVWCRITGHPPPRLSPEYEEAVKTMFRRVEHIWMNGAKIKEINPDGSETIKTVDMRPVGRHNFLSYNYFLYQATILIGATDFAQFFRLLKGAKKLQQQNEIWKILCQDITLNWQYIPAG